LILPDNKIIKKKKKQKRKRTLPPLLTHPSPHIFFEKAKSKKGEKAGVEYGLPVCRIQVYVVRKKKK
jgi:hypothetical protein